jgi:hypothetical protein
MRQGCRESSYGGVPGAALSDPVSSDWRSLGLESRVMLRDAVKHLFHRIGDDVASGPLANNWLETFLRAELEDKGDHVYGVEWSTGAGILLLDSASEILYTVAAPLTVSRELLNLRDAKIREDVELGDDTRARLTIELADGRALSLPTYLVLSRADQCALRSEIERRATVDRPLEPHDVNEEGHPR